MANPKKRLPLNADGDFFVDSTCINCDACRQLAPDTFADSGEFSFVRAQPRNATQRREAFRALLSCPTGSIGNLGHNEASRVKEDFPLALEDGVAYCGFNSPKSFGGNSYFIRHSEGNWLIDSPKYLPYLVGRFQEMGGISYIFLTHRDDVADAERYAATFGSLRIIHRAELDSQPGAEIVLDGDEPSEVAPDFLAIPTPGHTRGHCVLLYRQRFLFTGDHLDWDRDTRRLSASRDYCWYSWPKQVASMARLADYSFEWVLPGHGQRVHLSYDDMKRQMAALVERMRAEESSPA